MLSETVTLAVALASGVLARCYLENPGIDCCNDYGQGCWIGGSTLWCLYPKNGTLAHRPVFGTKWTDVAHGYYNGAWGRVCEKQGGKVVLSEMMPDSKGVPRIITGSPPDAVSLLRKSPPLNIANQVLFELHRCHVLPPPEAVRPTITDVNPAG
ncbi:hypothetical protein NOR_01793 [Metarhizium rileyi]|uniref:Uncharacterized protein n=1 Tax=Metarhizium rileyi (strain RCEF 4871) TaxID=1649241 RepID=A0A167I0W8_METRR|nr:hypothetical protein NOR_01793 [Metarhizium rileyi RCEF 4871]